MLLVVAVGRGGCDWVQLRPAKREGVSLWVRRHVDEEEGGMGGQEFRRAGVQKDAYRDEWTRQEVWLPWTGMCICSSSCNSGCVSIARRPSQAGLYERCDSRMSSVSKSSGQTPCSATLCQDTKLRQVGIVTYRHDIKTQCLLRRVSLIRYEIRAAELKMYILGHALLVCQFELWCWTLEFRLRLVRFGSLSQACVRYPGSGR